MADSSDANRLRKCGLAESFLTVCRVPWKDESALASSLISGEVFMPSPTLECTAGPCGSTDMNGESDHSGQ